MKTLILQAKDIKKLFLKIGIHQVMEDTIERIESYFKTPGIYEHRPRVGFLFSNGSVIEAMPAREKGRTVIFKIVNFHGENSSKKFPTVMSTTTLLDEKTGFPKVIADSTLLTYFRTGAAAAVATKYLAQKNSTVFGFVGAGSQAQACLHAYSRIFDVQKVYIWDTDQSVLPVFQKTMSKLVSATIEVRAPEEFIPDSNVLTVTTYGEEIVVESKWVKQGLHINTIGSDTPGKQELEPEILKRAIIVPDYLDQAILEGEVNVPISSGIISIGDIYGELHEIIKGEKVGRENANDITIFDSTGDPLEDLAVLQLILSYNNEHWFGKKSDFPFIPKKNPKDPYAELLNGSL